MDMDIRNTDIRDTGIRDMYIRDTKFYWCVQCLIVRAKTEVYSRMWLVITIETSAQNVVHRLFIASIRAKDFPQSFLDVKNIEHSSIN